MIDSKLTSCQSEPNSNEAPQEEEYGKQVYSLSPMSRIESSTCSEDIR